MIYADNAATTQMTASVIETMLAAMKNSWGNPSSLYDFGQKAKDALNSARAEIAACIGAKADEIYFLTNTDASPEHFSMEPAEQFAAVKDMRTHGWQLLGNFHSHPSSACASVRRR